MKKITFLLFTIFCFFILGVKAQKVGINNSNPQAALDIQGDIRLRSAVLTLPNGLNNNVDLITNKSSVYMFAGGALALGGCQITGFTGGVDGRIVTIFNNSTMGTIQLYDADFTVSPSVDSNKIATGTKKNAIIYGSGSVTLRYDGAIQKWTVIASHFTDGLSASPSPWLINGDNISNTNIGNVGIGTTTPPAAKLDVAGNVKITDGTQGAGKVLTSDANGVATWQNNNSNGSVGFGPWGDCTTSGYLTDFQPVANGNGMAFDFFGESVAISGDYAIVGAPYDDEDGFINNGSASIYKRNGSSGIWELQGGKLINTDPQSNDFFGNSVSISGDYAIVGAHYDDEDGFFDNGSASIYKRTGSSWLLQKKLKNSVPQDYDKFGSSVAISGDYAIVGAPGDSDIFFRNGSASIYKRNASTPDWDIQGNKLIITAQQSDDNFGSSVSISGDYAIVGAYLDDEGGFTDNGSVSIFKRNTSTPHWDIQGSKLINDIPQNSDYFGSSVSISGDYAIVGAYLDDEGGFSNNGSASIFKRNVNSWSLQKKLTNSVPQDDDSFGSSVAISGDYAIVGAPKDNESGFFDNGSASIYKRTESLWIKVIKSTNPSSSDDIKFGNDVSIDGLSKRFIIGNSGAESILGMVFFGKAIF